MQNETWEKEFDEKFVESDSFPNVPMAMKFPAPYIKDFIRTLLSSHNAELRRKIEKFIDENDDGMWAGRETADAVLALFDKKNV